METPIVVMVTLFVVLAVGTVLIVFARQTVEQAKMDLSASRPGQDTTAAEDQKIIQLSSVDNQQLSDLVTECYTRHHSKTFERELCFVVVAKQGAWTSAAVTAEVGIRITGNITFKDVNDNDYAMSIYFDPYGSSEKIEISK